jgi:hypothetical protein
MDLATLESRLLELSQEEPITHAAFRVAREVYGNKDKLSRYAFVAMCLAERVLAQNSKLVELSLNQALPVFCVEGTKTGRIQCETPNKASGPKREDPFAFKDGKPGPAYTSPDIQKMEGIHLDALAKELLGEIEKEKAPKPSRSRLNDPRCMLAVAIELLNGKGDHDHRTKDRVIESLGDLISDFSWAGANMVPSRYLVYGSRGKIVCAVPECNQHARGYVFSTPLCVDHLPDDHRDKRDNHE